MRIHRGFRIFQIIGQIKIIIIIGKNINKSESIKWFMKGDFGGVPYEIEGPTRGDTPCAHAQG